MRDGRRKYSEGSVVLLAACADYEEAHEHEFGGGGLFTEVRRFFIISSAQIFEWCSTRILFKRCVSLRAATLRELRKIR